MGVINIPCLIAPFRLMLPKDSGATPLSPRPPLAPVLFTYSVAGRSGEMGPV